MKIDDELITFESDPIPDSAKALRVGVNEFGNIVMIIEDESFPETEYGHFVPLLKPMYRSERQSRVAKVVVE